MSRSDVNQMHVFHGMGTEVDRRTLCQAASSLLICSSMRSALGRANAMSSPVTLITAPMELAGQWGGSPAGAALLVVKRMRDVCLAGIHLVSDQQPDRIRVDDHSSGPPAIWLHNDRSRTAWIIVDMGSRDWCKLAYQFGHELGHVLCNSWTSSARAQPPSQWLEESIVEAFSIRGLARLATSWEMTPPFAGDNDFSTAIRQYRQNLIDNYAKAVDRSSYTDLGSWFRKSQRALESGGFGLSPSEGPAILAILGELERDDAYVADMGALNRWPARTAVPPGEYLKLWEASCRELRASGKLPVRLRQLFGVKSAKGQ
jgi:hypothetical protein